MWNARPTTATGGTRTRAGNRASGRVRPKDGGAFGALYTETDPPRDPSDPPPASGSSDHPAPTRAFANVDTVTSAPAPRTPARGKAASAISSGVGWERRAKSRAKSRAKTRGFLSSASPPLRAARSRVARSETGSALVTSSRTLPGRICAAADFMTYSIENRSSDAGGRPGRAASSAAFERSRSRVWWWWWTPPSGGNPPEETPKPPPSGGTPGRPAVSTSARWVPRDDARCSRCSPSR